MGAKVNTEGDEGPSSQQAGMYVGDGLPPVPAKIAAKIGRWEPLPEFWTRKGKKQPSTSSAKRRVQDINVWLQCFASVMAIHSILMAYMDKFLRASQESAWTMYDAADRAATGHKEGEPLPLHCLLHWKGKKGDLCLSAAHKTDDCHLTVDEDPDLAVRMRAVESAVVAFSSGPKQRYATYSTRRGAGSGAANTATFAYVAWAIIRL